MLAIDMSLAQRTTNHSTNSGLLLFERVISIDILDVSTVHLLVY